MITVLSGGVGAARFLRALALVVDPADVAAVVNVGDDTTIHGLAISPDLDTILYTLAGAIDPERGWGLSGESWRVMEALDRYGATRPATSSAAATWFRLGDRDLATHLYRTHRLNEGATLTEVAAELGAAWGIRQRLLPATDAALHTMVTLASGDEVAFQDYFVRLRHDVAVAAIRFAGAPAARLTQHAGAALADAESIVIAPSNPLVSIAPIRAIGGVDECLRARRDHVVAVSPIVGGSALKGPADRMLTELGFEASVVGVARLYAPVAAHLVIDPADQHLAAAVEAEGMHPVVVPSVMSSDEVSAELARRTIAASQGA